MRMGVVEGSRVLLLRCAGGGRNVNAPSRTGYPPGGESVKRAGVSAQREAHRGLGWGFRIGNIREEGSFSILSTGEPRAGVVPMMSRLCRPIILTLFVATAISVAPSMSNAQTTAPATAPSGQQRRGPGAVLERVQGILADLKQTDEQKA